MNRVIPYLIIHVNHPDKNILKEIMSGIEEEEVLYQVVYSDSPKDSVTLAYAGARQSSLGVGIGISENNYHIAIQQQLAPVLIKMDCTSRNTGHNAARLVKKKPLR